MLVSFKTGLLGGITLAQYRASKEGSLEKLAYTVVISGNDGNGDEVVIGGEFRRDLETLHEMFGWDGNDGFEAEVTDDQWRVLSRMGLSGNCQSASWNLMVHRNFVDFADMDHNI